MKTARKSEPIRLGILLVNGRYPTNLLPPIGQQFRQPFIRTPPICIKLFGIDRWRFDAAFRLAAVAALSGGSVDYRHLDRASMGLERVRLARALRRLLPTGCPAPTL